MTCNYFNSKVNLPKFCGNLGYTDYQYVKLPTFGWYAYNKSKTFIGNIFDLVGQQDKEALYSLITKEKPEYLDFELPYASMTNNSIKYNLIACQLWSAVFAYARKELETYKISYKGKRVLLKTALIESGYSALLNNNIGVLTSSIVEKFNMLPWPKRELRGKILIPSFSTPMHICSLEYCAWDDPTQLQPLWLNDEKGWYGNLNSKKIVGSVKDLWTNNGTTWDYKLDYWAPDGITTLDNDLSVPTALRVWSEGKNITFDKSPLEKILDAGKLEELKHHIGNISYQQLEEVEKLTGESLIACWRQAREHQVQIGTRMFTRRDNCYWVFKKGKLEQVTNFAIELEKIIKEGNKFYRLGTIHYGDSLTPFKMEERYFTTNYLFHRGLKEKFLTAGIGVPIVHPDFFNKALLIIDSFNQGVTVDTAAEQST